jgi:hypothetical protein
MPDDRDLLEDLLLPKDPEPTPGLDPKEMEDLKAQLAESQTAQKGLLKNVQEERRKRQEIKGRLDQVTTTVNSILEQRENLAAQNLEPQAQKDKDAVEGITVEFTEAGDAFIPSEKLSAFTSKYEDEIATLKEELASTRETQTSSQEYQQAVDAMIGEKAEYAAAHRSYQTARKWISDVVADWSLNNNVNRPLNSGEALTHVLNDEVAEEFKQRFPELDMVTVTTAEDSPWHFKTMLAKTAESLNSIETEPTNSRFRQVINKPSSLGKSANAKGGEVSLAEKLASLSATDIMNLKDEQLEAVTNYLREDEEKDGINW